MESVDLNGAKCLNYRCDQGEYTIDTNEEQGLNYYNQVYNRSQSPRIYASEHTGLLERGRREQIEIDFKSGDKFNSYNAVSYTHLTLPTIYSV